MQPFRVGERVKIGPKRPNGTPHPHAGRTGKISEFHSILSNRAIVQLDTPPEEGHFIVVLIECLEHS